MKTMSLIKKIIAVPIALYFSVMIVACNQANIKIKPDNSASTTIDVMTNLQNDNIDALEKNNMIILDSADQSISNLASNNIPEVQTGLIEIQSKALNNKEKIQDLRKLNLEIKGQVSTIKQLEKKVADLLAEIERIRAGAIKSLYQYVGVFFGIGFALMVIGGIIFIYNKRLGMTALAIGGVATGLSAAATYYLKQIAFAGMVIMAIGVLGSIAVLLYTLLHAKKESKAMTETVKAVEIAKGKLPEETKNTIFGDGEHTGIFGAVQSDSTKKIVEKTRDKIDLSEFTSLGLTGG